MVKGEKHQTVSVVADGIDGATLITVTAQDGTTTSTYTLNFLVKLSANALLNAILVDGALINDFDSNDFDYTFVLPYGTSELPQIDYEKGHPNQTIVISGNGVNGNYTIQVTSEDGSQTNTYVIRFSVALSPNALLSSILSNEVEVTGFIPEMFEYQVAVIYGSSEVPTITWTKGDKNQLVVPTYAATLNDTTFLRVTSEDGLHTSTYKIYFELRKSNNALLADIIIGGESLKVEANGYITDTYFLPEQSDYNIILPYGTTELPTIEWIGQVSDYSHIRLNASPLVNGAAIARIELLAQDGITENEYVLSFTVAKSSNTTLLDILIDGVSLENFRSDSLEYTIYYPVGTSEDQLLTADDFAYLKAEPSQEVSVSEGDNHVIIITVKAEDGSSSSYIIKQIIRQSDNALLADILVDNVSLKGFKPEIFKYTYKLPYGTKIVPELTYVKSEEGQIVDISYGFVDETSYIYVSAIDGTEKIYEIFFEVSTDNPGDTPTADDVCFSPYGEGVWKASSKRNNVSVVIYDASGRMIYKAKVPASDHNDICRSDVGAKFQFAKKGQVYFYCFYYNNAKRIGINGNGKFLY
jgi:hypothetical protein